VDYLLAPYHPAVLRAKVAAFVELHRHELQSRELLDARRLAEEAQAHRAVLSALRADVSTALGCGRALEDVLQRCAQALVDRLGAAFARIWLLGPEDVLVLQASAGLYTRLDGSHARVPVGHQKVGRIARDKQPHLSNDVLGDAQVVDREWARREGMRAFAGYPLLVEGRLVGVIAMFSRREVASDTLEALATIADTIALGVERKRIEAELRVGNARFRRIFESNLLGIVFTNYEGAVLDANEAFLSLVGYTREELADGRIRWDTLTPPEWTEANAKAVQQLRTQGVVHPFEKEYLHRQGHRVPVLVGSTRVEEQERNITFVLDLTERKRAEANLRFLAEASAALSSTLDLRTVLQQVADSVVPGLADWCGVDLLTEQGQVQRLAVAHRDPRKVDLAFESARRWPMDVKSHGGIAQVLRTGEPLLLKEVSEGLLAAMARSPEHLAMLQLLGLRSAVCVPLTARGRVLGAVTLSYSESDRRYGEADVVLVMELARRAALAVDNARLYLEARDAVRLRDEFLSVASHELKTPLTSLRLQLALIQRNLGEDSRGRVGGRVSTVERQVDRLKSLVESLLDVSRIRTGGLTLELGEVDLAEVVREVAAQFEDTCAQTGSRLELEGSGPLVGWWDRSRLEQVVVNLFSNALKYGAGRPIHVRWESTPERARLVVRDEGIGIAPEALERIFLRFERAVSERHYGGLGLGLYISRQVVEALGGNIRAESTPGQGATFTVELPWRVGAAPS
jgi:PAS domain S-box-containing protein